MSAVRNMSAVRKEDIDNQEGGLPFAAAPVVEEQEQNTAGVAIEFVTLKIRRSQPKRLINIIAQANSNIEVEEGEDAYTLTAPYIRIKRSDVEAITGSISDTKWRMLFMNRVGEIREFTSLEFSMGVPQPTQTEVERREWTQMNVRLPKDLKDEMEILRSPEILAMSQNEFVTEAIAEYISMLKRERV